MNRYVVSALAGVLFGYTATKLYISPQRAVGNVLETVENVKEKPTRVSDAMKAAGDELLKDERERTTVKDVENGRVYGHQ